MAIKVIQWATGAIGKTCLRFVIERPDLELVGLFTYSERKTGRDAGDIARRAPTGISATNSIDEILAIDADVVLHLPLNPAETFQEHDDVIKRLLRSGKSVITTIAHTFVPAMGRDYLAGFEQACHDGQSVLFGTGVHPGLIVERLAVAATGMSCQIDAIETTEVYDLSEIVSPGFVFDLCGVGKPLAAIRESDNPQLVFDHIFREMVAYVGHALDIKFDSIESDHEFAVGTEPLEMPVGRVEPGGVVNFRWRYRGMKNGRPFYTGQVLWIADKSLPGWNHEDGWEIAIDGAPKIRMRIDLHEPDNMPDRSKAMQYCVAATVINAIQDVVSAPPGVLIPPHFGNFRAPG